MVEAIAQDLADALFDLADVHQHSGRGIDDAGKNKMRDVVAPGAVARRGLRAEGRHVLGLAPLFYEKTSGGGKFEAFADRQKHDAPVRQANRERNSDRVRASSLNEPRRQEVFIT